MAEHTGKRETHYEHTITEPINLGSLRWLVKQSEGMPDSSTVEIREHKSHGNMDWDEASIKVKGIVV